MSRPTVYEFAGGDAAFLRLAHAHHERCLADPVLNHPFSHGGHPEHVQRLAAYWAEVLGGPPNYSAQCGDQSAMLTIHSSTGAEDELGTRFVDCFLNAADDADLPDDPEFRQVLGDYMKWAVGTVMSFAPQGSTVPADQPMPHWTWEGLA